MNEPRDDQQPVLPDEQGTDAEPDFLALAGSIKVPADRRNASCEEVVSETRLACAPERA